MLPERPAAAQDGLYDCTWSESNDNHLVSASGDGSLKVGPSLSGNAIRTVLCSAGMGHGTTGAAADELP